MLYLENDGTSSTIRENCGQKYWTPDIEVGGVWMNPEGIVEILFGGGI